MKKKILPILLLLVAIPVFAQYTVRGGSGTPFLAEDNTASRIKVYLLNGLNGAEISYTSNDGSRHQWYRYTQNANNATPVSSVQDGNTSTITDVQSDCGYFVGDPADVKTSYIWIIDYSVNVPVIKSLVIDDGASDVCDVLKLLIDVDAPTLSYYTYNGTHEQIKRKYTLKYSTLKWDKDNLIFNDENKVDTLTSEVEFPIDPAPLKDTDFTLSGDQFAAHFGLEQQIKTPVYSAIRVEAHIDTFIVRQPSDNLLEEGAIEGENEIGGSAPIDVTFTAYANEPVAVMYIWELYDLNSKSPDPIVRYNGKEFRYTFDGIGASDGKANGRFLVRLNASDRTNTCIDSSNFYNVTILIYDLTIPNVFTPHNQDGKNDVFRVSYRSLLSFKGWVFSQWGNQLYYWTDPAGGWDGKVRGKTVPTGAYYYVIEVEVPDSNNKTKKIKRKGDINVIRSTRENSGGDEVL